MKHRFGKKAYKLSFDAGMTCPNRDGTIGREGCVFCSNGGSGDFAVDGSALSDEAIDKAVGLVEKKLGEKDHVLIAYYQSFSNTYGSVERLREIFTPAITHPLIAALSIGTRPDCLPEDVLSLLSELNRIKPVWVELGLQTIHEDTASFINRGYTLEIFDRAVRELRNCNIECIVHVILGLPGEDKSRMLDTVRYVSRQDIQGIKLQLLHILKDTPLYEIYRKTPFHVFSMEEYIDLIIECVSIIPPEMVIHRLTGDGPKRLLAEPAWSGDKKRVLNTMMKRFQETGIYQGCRL